ncbi:ABC transporter substrate-binding protein [Phytoactinopolyspora endophytica]|uniref:ABC transporter substrate-binding protein n=1 Tax=Phytoactinopolyspora endophytica TaxID=1642495 RepID=UPI00101C7B48|nr:ABC transporter substrate-binding protein [Phytoactinopolyspora endophytica]
MKDFPRFAVLAVIPMVLVACGNDDDASEAAEPGQSETTAAEASFPVTVGDGDAAVEIPAAPERIVSLSPTATEMLFAIDAGDEVVAADEYSNYPEEAPTTDLSGFEPNVEAIVGYDPDLVVASSDPGQLVSSLAEIDVPTLVLAPATSLDDTYSQIEQLGAATGNVGEAAEVVAGVRSDIDEIIAEVPEDAEDVTYFHEVDSNLYTVTGSTFIGELYGLAGMVNIADEAPEAGGEYPQLSPEFIVSADPDMIFFADGGEGGVTTEDIAGRPGWDELTAVREDRVFEVDSDVASRWGPRVVDYLRFLVDERVGMLEPVG